jgi:hypothetical protein
MKKEIASFEVLSHPLAVPSVSVGQKCRIQRFFGMRRWNRSKSSNIAGKTTKSAASANASKAIIRIAKVRVGRNSEKRKGVIALQAIAVVASID